MLSVMNFLVVHVILRNLLDYRYNKLSFKSVEISINGITIPLKLSNQNQIFKSKSDNHSKSNSSWKENLNWNQHYENINLSNDSELEILNHGTREWIKEVIIKKNQMG